MRTHILLKGAIGALALGLALPTGSAYAEDSIYVPLFTYRTGPFAGSGTPFADGMHDYLTMLNERTAASAASSSSSMNADKL
jgi:branched-chain amino acid transport system substrate-binding protein